MAQIDFFIPQANDGSFDIQIGKNLDFVYVQGWDTLFSYQLFVDRRGTKFDTALPRQRGGWIGDLFTKESGYESGSFLWTKKQARNTQNDLNEVSALSEHALQYFVEAGVAKQITASVNSAGTAITGTITIDSATNNQYTALWVTTGMQTS